jgi:hypothetical protein
VESRRYVTRRTLFVKSGISTGAGSARTSSSEEVGESSLDSEHDKGLMCCV